MNLEDSEIRILNILIHFLNQRCSRSLRRVDSGFFFFLDSVILERTEKRNVVSGKPDTFTVLVRSTQNHRCCWETKSAPNLWITLFMALNPGAIGALGSPSNMYLLWMALFMTLNPEAIVSFGSPFNMQLLWIALYMTLNPGAIGSSCSPFNIYLLVLLVGVVKRSIK